MSDAPEKIWAQAGFRQTGPFTSRLDWRVERGEWRLQPSVYTSAEYIRADIAEARIAELEAALISLAGTIEHHGDWDDACFYYNRTAAPELQSPLQAARAALETLNDQ
jgi:hypothetical protein